VKRTAWITFAVAIVVSLAWTGGQGCAQGAAPTMRVTAGFDGYCRHGNGGGWCPVYAVLSNEGVGVEGELRVAVGGTGGGARDNVYARRVVLPAHSRKAYFLYVPSDNSSSRLTVQLRVGDDAGEGTGGELLSSQQVTVSWLNDADRLYGVASSSPSALNFLSDVAPASARAVVAHIDLEALPPDPLGWEGLDVLVLNDVDTTVLSGGQRRALETWVAHGGHLIVGGGAGAARTVAGVADLLPVAVGGIHSVDDLWALGERMSAPIVAGPYAVAEAGLRDGEILIEQREEQSDGRGDLILLARRAYGAGRVDYMAFDAGLNSFARWDDNTLLWKWIVEPKVTGAERFTIHNGYSAHEAVNAIPGLELPSTLQLLAFMLVYTLLIGPVNYVVLRKLDRRELAWLTIPALVVGFTACAYVTGFQIRGGAAIVHRLAVVYVPERTGVGRVSEVVGIFSPQRTSYDVWVAGVGPHRSAGVREIPGDYYGALDRQPLHVTEAAEGLTVDNLRVDVGGIQPFVVEGYADVPAVEADLQLVVGGSGRLRVEGTLRNGGALLKKAVLIAGDDEQRLGDLEAGEEVSVHLLYSHGYGGLDLPGQILGPGNYWEDRELYRRYQFLQALFSYSGMALGKGAYLVGWAEEAPLPVGVVERPFSTVGTALYVYALPVTGLERGTVVTIPPGLITRLVEETEGVVDVWPEGMHLEPEAAVVFRFAIWPGVTVRQVDELVLDLQGSSYGYKSRSPVVSLWNGESGDWERLDVGWGRHSIPNAGAYVIPSGDVRVRLETDTGWSADVDSLTVTIKGQR